MARGDYWSRKRNHNLVKYALQGMVLYLAMRLFGWPEWTYTAAGMALAVLVVKLGEWVDNREWFHVAALVVGSFVAFRLISSI